MSFVSTAEAGLEQAATQPDHVVFLESTKAEYIVNRDCRQVKGTGSQTNSQQLKNLIVKGTGSPRLSTPSTGTAGKLKGLPPKKISASKESES